MNCYICNTPLSFLFTKNGYDYHQCGYCKSIFIPEGIDQTGMVGGEHEVGRNGKENSIRIERIKNAVGRHGRILDFGCGHGYLVKDCKDAGLDCVGYDKFNPDFDKMPEGQFNFVSVVECIEHTHLPFVELDIIFDKLLPNGVVMIETSFWDVSIEEDIPIESFFYLAPENGHCTVFSHFGLDLLMKKKGFTVIPPINRNVRMYKK